MIDIYIKSNNNFDFNGDMVLKPYLCELEVELNGIIEVTLEHTYDKEGRWKYIEKDNLLRVPYPFKKERQLFYIYDIDKGMTSIKCKARHIFFDLASEVLVDCRPTNCNGEEALNKILSSTDFIGHSNIASINTAYYIRKHISNEVLISEDENSFISKWGGELDVDNFNVYLNERVGLDNGITFKYSKDLINLNENSNIDDIVTRILPVGFDGITIPEVYVESPLINSFRKVRTKVIKFEDVKVKEESDDEDGYDTLEQAQEALREACKKLFNEGLDKLLLQLDLEVTKLENTLKYEQFKDIMTVGLGDTVGVEHLDIGINVKTRVIKFIYDCISEKFKSITLGNYIENDLDNQNDIDSIIDKITNSDGTVNAVEVAGVLNAVNVQMRAMKDIAQKQDIRALLCEDLDPESPTYGAMCYGTMGFMIASQRTPDNRDWDWRTFGTGKGFFADLIVAGTMLADRIKSGLLMSMNEKTWINMDDGTFNFCDLLAFDGNEMKMKDTAFKIVNQEDQIIAYIGQDNWMRIQGVLINGHGECMQNKGPGSRSLKLITTDGGATYIDFNANEIDNYTVRIIREAGSRFLKTLASGLSVQSFTANTACGVEIRSNGDSAYLDFAYNSVDDYNVRLLVNNNDRNLYCHGTGFVVKGDLKVEGAKNCIHNTENYGQVSFYAIEDCESYLTDRSMEVFSVEETKTGTFERVILLDRTFKECVNLSESYTVNVIKQGFGDYRIKEQNENYFIVESDRKDFTFKYIVTARRKGYENLRLEEFFSSESEVDNAYKNN